MIDCSSIVVGRIYRRKSTGQNIKVIRRARLNNTTMLPSFLVSYFQEKDRRDLSILSYGSIELLFELVEDK